MEIDVTLYVQEHDCSLYSDSIANSGLQNIGEITWNNALQHVAAELICKLPSELQELRDYFADFGAWDSEEIDAFSDQELNALLLQDIASNVRELEGFPDVESYQEAAESGQVSGRLFEGDNGNWFFYVGM